MSLQEDIHAFLQLYEAKLSKYLG